MPDTLETCAAELLDVMPLVMQELGRTMRGLDSPDLRVPELRTLAFLRRNPGSNLTDLAEHIGVSLPSMSKLVDTLTYRGLVERTPDTSDRRRICLGLTETGSSVLSAAREAVKASFATKLSRLGPPDIETVAASLQLLRGLFAVAPDGELAPPRA